MKTKPAVTINPSLSEKYKNIKLSAEMQKKHDELAMMVSRMKTHQKIEI
jgi:hypothetical protein